MEIELKEIRDFIAEHPPFEVLNDDTLDQLPSDLTIRYFPQGTSFPDPSIDSKSLYIVRTGAIEVRTEDGQLVDKLAEGDVHLLDEATDDKGNVFKAVCVEDTLAYLLNYEKLEKLKACSDSFKHQFDLSINDRLRNAVETSQSADMRDLSAMKLEARDLTVRMPVVVDSSVTIQQAAQTMSDEFVSSILITTENKLTGLLTDKDIRRRCVAAGLSYDEPVSTIMSNKLEKVSDNTLVSEALLLMTRNKINHLPLMKGDTAVGILTTSDIIRHLSASPTLIASDIYHANSVDALKRISNKLPELQLQLSLSSATAKHIGEVISSITDSITSRLIELAEEKYGKPPVDYVWLAGGSQARNEQTSHSDQDNAIIISDDYQEEHEEYFKCIADFVCDGLNDCGYIYCPGDAMAKNPQWRQPLEVWHGYFSHWITSPEPKALMLSSIFFDLRPIYGADSLFEKLHQKVLEQTRNNEFFIAHMVANALTHQPPLGFFRNFVMVHDDKHKNTLDIKHRGIVPIVDLARVMALANGLSETNTTDRLNVALQSKALSHEMHDNLVDAMEYIGSLRIRHQAKQIREGLEADNYLPIIELSGLEKNHLKDSFSVIKTMQEFYENRYSSSRVR
jgi:CBS domain-containing protein